jgi:hypothetical protein
MEDVMVQIPHPVRKAFWNQLTTSVNGGHNNLLPLGIYLLCKRLTHMRDVGVKRVAVDQIRGTVGLSSDFDRSFMPRQEYIRHEWTNVDQSRFHNETLRFINLLKIRDTYFVLDAHHWLSMAPIQDQESIEAHVIEVEEYNER